MSGTKIIVFQLKEVIRTAIFAIIGVLLIIGLIYFFLPKKSGDNEEPTQTQEETLYLPGTYKAQINLHKINPLNVFVTVSESKITKIALAETNEELDYFYPLIKMFGYRLQ